MSDVEASVRHAATPHLRAGEHIQGVGLASRAIPALAASVPLFRSIYMRHYLLAVTNERLLAFPTNVPVLGDVTEPTTAPFALEYADIARLEPCHTLVYGSAAMRFTLRAGLEHEFTYRPTVRNLSSQAAFAASFPGWLGPLLATGAYPVRPAAERTLPTLPGRPMVGAWLLLIVGSLVVLAGVLMALMAVTTGLEMVVAAALPLVAMGAAAIAGGVHLRRKRAAQLGNPPIPFAELYRQKTSPAPDQARAVFLDSGRPAGVVVVSGPDAALSSRIAQRIAADPNGCPGFSTERCLAEFGGRLGDVVAGRLPLRIGATTYLIDWNRKPMSTSCASNETGLLCVNVDLSGASFRDNYERNRKRTPWSRWALNALSHP